MTRSAVTVGAALMLAGVWVGCGGPRFKLLDRSAPLQPRPQHFGLSLPYPVSAMPFPVDSLPVDFQGVLALSLTLTVDQAGKVTQVTPVVAGDSTSVERFRASLLFLEFEPGLYNGSPTAMPLRIELEVHQPGALPVVHYPVGPNREITDGDLYWSAFAELGVEVARLRCFPSYYYAGDRRARWERYPYQIYRVELDSTGDVMEVELVRATDSAYHAQIRSAIIWGEYQPLKIMGQAVGSSNFLVVSLLPTVDYPTLPLCVDGFDTANVWDRMRVRLLTDTVGLLAPPIPKVAWSGRIREGFIGDLPADLLSARICVDAEGGSVVERITSDNWRWRRVFTSNAHHRRFFPAIDFAGRPRPWCGQVWVRYLDNSNARIWFSWAPQPDPGPPIVDSPSQ